MRTCKLFVLLFAIAFSINLSAQDFNLSAVTGYLNLDVNFKVDGEEINLDNPSSGFYIGAQTEFELTEKIDLQPELVLGIVEDSNALYLGVLGKYSISDDFSALFGPSFNYVLEDFADNYQNFGIALTVGVGYDISEDFFAQAKYSFQINNYYNGDADITSKANFLLFGIGYKIL